MKKEILFFDMDSVLVNFQSGIDATPKDVLAQYEDDGTAEHKSHYDDIPGIFSRMKPVEGAVEAVKTLREKYDVYILSTAPWGNPSAWTDKLEWVKKHFDSEENQDGVFYKRLILSHHKNLCYQPGAWLIDDRPNHGAELFGDHWIKFGSERFENWETVVKFLMNREDVQELEDFCHHHGFVFRKGNNGTYRRGTYWSFYKNNEKDDTAFSIEYYPEHRVKISSRVGAIDVSVWNVSHLLQLLESMKIDVNEVQNKEQSRATSKYKMELRMKIANDLAHRIEEHYGFYYDKCVDMAMQGEWWNTKSLSALAMLHVPTLAPQIFKDIDDDKIL